MTLAALLTVFSITLAIFSLARPVGRRSLALFVPLWWMVAAICLSFICIVVRDAPFGVKPPLNWPLDLVEFGLSIGAFIAPVVIALWCWWTWYQAKLTRRNVGRLENVIKASIREDEFDEIERIISKNKGTLSKLPASAASALFNPKVVAALVGSNSMVHLELLSNMEFVRSLDNRLGAVDVVVRQLLRAPESPLQSAVSKSFGGLENLEYTDTQRTLMEKTFLNPQWYMETRADYPLVILAIEELNSGKHNYDYNNIGRAYQSEQGISTRSQCPIYIAAKTIVLAIDTAIEQHTEGDFYISELHDIFRAVQQHSKFTDEIWDSDLADSDFPTPFAYLLHEIAYDFRNLSCAAVKSAACKAAQHQVQPSGRIARDLAQMWSYCAWSIADSEKQVSPNFRDGLIREYLNFILQLGWAPSEVYYGPSGNGVQGLEAWRDLFAEELQQRFAGDSGKRLYALKSAMESLDTGKMYVFHGYDWLQQKLLSS